MKFSKVAAFIATPILLAGSGFLIVDNVNTFVQEEEEYLPYVQLAGTQSMGSQWLEDFMSQQPFAYPNGGKSDNWHKTATNRTLITDSSINCVEPQPIPAFVLDAHTASNNIVTISAATTQPGMSKSLIDNFESRASDCEIDFLRNGDSRVDIGSNANTSILFYGDTAVSVNFSNNFRGDKEILIGEVQDSIISSLETFRCNNIETDVNDRKRNVYYTTNNDPVGKFQTDTVKTEEDTVNLPTLVDISPSVINYPNLVKPEAPYPADFPDVPENEVTNPVVPALPEITSDTFEKDVTFEVPDFEGAGCGWEWSAGQKTPIYDVAALEQYKKDKKKEALNEVNDSAKGYISSYLNTIGSRATAQSSVVRWNKYAHRVNYVHTEWLNLENARAAMKPDYDAFIEAWRNWETFDERKDIAEEFYEKEVEFCEERDDNFIQWQEDGGEEEAPMPAICGDVERPEILDMNKGAEPVFTPPEGVTIPESWEEKEDADLSARVNEIRSETERNFNDLVSRLEQVDEDVAEQWREDREAESSTSESPEPESPLDRNRNRNDNDRSVVERIEDGDFIPEIPDLLP